MTREEAYEQVAKLAKEHALIAQGFGGVLTIVHPETQREHGIEAKCLYMAGQGPWPERQAEQSKADNCTNTEVPKIPAIWAKSLVDCWPDDANDFDGDWCIGVISEDGEPREVVKVEASQYDATGESQKIAEAIVLLWAFAARAQAGGGS